MEMHKNGFYEEIHAVGNCAIMTLLWTKSFNEVLRWALFMKHNLRFGMVWPIVVWPECIYNRFGKLGKTQGKPYCNSKAMGIHFPQPIFISIFEKKNEFSCYMTLLRMILCLDSRYCQEDMTNLKKE